ncbi:MAG: aspartate--tRNA ligase [Candidatus Omnitrophica bacterium]|nr:aspartate--tRNA ligase [Candidatus Omnitrophota bacterium]
MYRTHTCGELTAKNLGDKVTLAGWVHRRRDHGGLIFIDLRDRYGLTQIVFNPSKSKELHDAAESLRGEYVIMVEGEVASRPKGTENPKLKTGEIEIAVSKLTILNTAQTPPFEIDDEGQISEEMRFTYRFVDLRRKSSRDKLIIRHKVCHATRNFLESEGFIEVETPILTKSTPEGARDYLVPSRLSQGKFFALPQSPQLFKQILMVAGMDRYFQIAKCFRDEDLRADRQPEFTQLDIEMSFVDVDDILGLTERLIKAIFKEGIGVELKTPFPRIKHSESIERFGTDKPDTRFGMELSDLTDTLKGSQFQTFEKVTAGGGIIKALNLKGKADISRSEIDGLTELAIKFGAKGLAYFKAGEGAVDCPIAKFFDEGRVKAMLKKMDAAKGDLILAVADKKETVNDVLAHLRTALAKKYGPIDKNKFDFLWVVEFPWFKYNDEEKRWEAEHHPFTAPYDEDIGIIDTHPEKVRAKAYDLVLNGTEISSGSIRIHNRETQLKIFKAIGLSEEEIKARFGFLLEAFSYGAPPHGGIAPGLDRLIAMMTGSESIRDVIAFPKTQKAVCFMTGAPSDVSEKQLKELGLILKDSPSQSTKRRS